MATDSYKQMSDSVFEMNWPELPNSSQKFIILMIENMQKPLYYHGFGIVNLDLETFAKVKHSNSFGCKIKSIFVNFVLLFCCFLAIQVSDYLLHGH